MGDFLPKDYKVPSQSGYMKFEEGENKFRILGPAVVGTEYWVMVEGKKMPKRVKPDVDVNMEDVVVDSKFGTKQIYHFWAFPVFNYQASKVQILEIKQKSIQLSIAGFVNNPKWGDPTTYDITVVRTVEGGRVKYAVMPDPKEELDSSIREKAKESKVNLEALFDGGDPFK
jgi:hypothetical protein